MKPFNRAAVYALAAYTVLALTACPKTDNGSNDTAAAAATQCTMSYDGTLRDQYGRSCAGTTSYACQGYTYNGQTGMYINPQTGQQIPAASCGGTNVIPNNGYYGNQYVGGQGGYGCQQWSQYYGITYVPVDTGGGNLVCVNWQYLQSQMMVSYPQYQQTQYVNPSYWYSNPPTYYDPGYGYGSGYGGYGYGYSGCGSSISLGFQSGGFGVGGSICF